MAFSLVWNLLAGAFPVPPLEQIPDRELVSVDRAGAIAVVPRDRPQAVARLETRLKASGVDTTAHQRYAIGAIPIGRDLHLVHLKMH